jgi:dTDP-4-dehydrorhamnose reductase
MPKILLTGASSYVGARLYHDLKGYYDLTGTYFNNPLGKNLIKLDLTDENSVRAALKKYQPEMIVHVANFPSPRSAVNNEFKFIKLNQTATEILVRGVNSSNAKFIFISSQAANNPDNIYGKLKLESEALVKTIKTGYVILRPSMIVGFSPNITNDRPFNRILKCLDNKTIGAEFDISWKLQPSYIGHIFQVIRKVIDNHLWDRIIPIFIDELVTQYQIASDILDHYGITVKPVDLGINVPPSNDDLNEFNRLIEVPITYKQMVEIIIEEIDNRNEFKVR